MCTHIHIHIMSHISLSARSAPLRAQRIIGSYSISRVSNGICLSSEAFFHPRLRPPYIRPMPYINSAQFETYRRCLPLCVFADSSRVKLVFIAIRAPRNSFTSIRTTRNHLGFPGFQRGEILDIGAMFFTAIRYIYWTHFDATRDVTYISPSCALSFLKTNLPVAWRYAPDTV